MMYSVGIFWSSGMRSSSCDREGSRYLPSPSSPLIIFAELHVFFSVFSCHVSTLHLCAYYKIIFLIFTEGHSGIIKDIGCKELWSSKNSRQWIYMELQKSHFLSHALRDTGIHKLLGHSKPVKMKGVQQQQNANSLTTKWSWSLSAAQSVTSRT